MNGAVVKRTQDTLGKVIKKPPLTEKLLNKPPFRYLHDIFSEVIRTTGFMKGLYVEHEMKSDNVKEKDSKIAFLQKAIDVVMLVSGEPLAAKPARIVAGHEPERTNELLQAIAKCCLNKMSSEDAVKRVLESRSKASTSRSQDKENREGREPHRDRDERREILERSGSREQKAPGQEPGGQQETRERQRTRERRGKEREKDKEREPQREKDKERGEPQREKDKERGDAQREKDKERGEPQREKDKERGEPQREKDRGQEKGREREKEREREKTRDRDSHRERDRDRDKRRDREKDRDRPKEGEERGNRKTRVPEEPKQRAHPEEPSKSSKAAPTPADVLENQSESPARIPRPSSAKGQRRRPNVGGQDESDSDGDGEAALTEKATPQENGEATEPTGLSNMTPSIRQTPRPSSARPAAPRVKTQERYADVSPAERLASSKALAAVIMEGKKLSEDEDDEDEQFILDEAACKAQGVEIDGDEKHGGLVKKILETKKDYESSPSSPKAKEQSVVSEGAQRKERDLVSREMERMRCSIQAVCKSTSPLGKIVQYAQEDMDAMQVELLAWRRESKEHAQALLLERRATERAVEPLKADLEELDQLIKDQQDKNCAIKSNILKNQEKIQKMVAGINFSSRT